MHWKAHTKGGPNTDTWEIAVLKRGNSHGRLSYGWFGEDKIFIASSGGPCHDKVNELVWELLVRVAHRIASVMNKARGKK